MVIKEQDLLNYISCPIKYNLSNNGYDIDKKTYNTFLHEVYKFMISIYHYEGIELLDEKMKKKWDTICFKNQDIITSKKVIEGYGILYKVYEYLRNNKPKLVDINIPYEITVDKYVLTGTIDMVIDKGGQYEILVPSFSKTLSESFYIDNNLKYTIAAYIVDRLYNKMVVINCYNFIWSNSKYTLRNTKDFNRMKKIIQNVGTCIEHELMYPRIGHHCNTCKIKGLCAMHCIE